MKLQLNYIYDNTIIVNDMLDENIIINKKLYNDLNLLKNNMDGISGYKWRLVRSIVTKYEMIGNNKLHNIQKLHDIDNISRAYFKLWEILNYHENILKIKTKSNMRIAGLAEAPGGFLKCLIDYRKDKNDDITGISLLDSIDNKIEWYKFDNQRIKIIYGNKPHHNGNLMNPEIINAYCNYYRTERADLVTADGGLFISKGKESYKGFYHNHLFLCEIYTALKILNDGGSYIMKIYDICNRGTFDLLLILDNVFEYINIYKPETSREMNDEKYIVCSGYKRNNKILTELYHFIVEIWDKRDEIIITHFIKKYKDYNNKNSEYSKINNSFLMKQKQNILRGLHYAKLNMGSLRKLLRMNYNKKKFDAQQWIVMNNLQ
jgi:23S rRNA U2552 (ribose-2'-O)-methylase RlmE/FtsJ